MQDPPDQLIFIFNYMLLLLLIKDSVITKLLGKWHFWSGKKMYIPIKGVN